MAYIGFVSNYFKQIFGQSVQPSDTESGGDFFELNPAGSIRVTADPISHPMFKTTSDGSITFYSRQDNGYYFNLITPLYRNKPNFMDWLEAELEPIPYSDWCVALLNDAFDLDQAEGVQLDILGTIVGISRQVDFEPTDGSGPVLNDSVYRKLIKCTIAKNQWDGKIESLQPIWKSVEPGAVIMVLDNQNMTMGVSVFGTIDSTFRDLVENGYIVPKPQAVRINSVLYAVNGHPMPAFGFDMDDDNVSGFDKGTWVVVNTWLGPPAFGFDMDDVNVTGFVNGAWFVVAPDHPSFGWDQNDMYVAGFENGLWLLTES